MGVYATRRSPKGTQGLSLLSLFARCTICNGLTAHTVSMLFQDWRGREETNVENRL
jgi:hypothetical protein